MPFSKLVFCFSIACGFPLLAQNYTFQIVSSCPAALTPYAMNTKGAVVGSATWEDLNFGAYLGSVPIGITNTGVIAARLNIGGGLLIATPTN